MNTADDEREALLQRQAEQPDGPADDAGTARYRAVYRALRAAPVPPPPAGFATTVERAAQARSAGDDAHAFERWGVRAGIALLVLLLAGGMLAAPALAEPLAELIRLPWPLLSSPVAALLVFAALDRRRAGPA